MAQQDETGCEQVEGPILCANHCGFFGNRMTLNYCSKCYKDIVLVQTMQAKLTEEKRDQSPAVAASSASAAAAEESSAAEVDFPVTDVEKSVPKGPSNRCWTCNKRVGLLGFNCRCGSYLCALHRHSDKHECSYDYKTAAREAISKANPIIKASKFDKI